ncbi:MAG: hypothetical protein K2Y14_01005 [Burkholderiales bacterium]|nr:hypothetical protein [Burkholderiales bacterium]
MSELIIIAVALTLLVLFVIYKLIRIQQIKLVLSKYLEDETLSELLANNEQKLFYDKGEKCYGLVSGTEVIKKSDGFIINFMRKTQSESSIKQLSTDLRFMAIVYYFEVSKSKSWYSKFTNTVKFMFITWGDRKSNSFYDAYVKSY